MYNLNKKRIERIVFSKPRIKVVFFVLYDNMWKSDELFCLLKSNDRFDPYIISSPYPNHPRKFSIENQLRVEEFFIKKGFPFIRGFDFSSNTWFDIASFKPDIVFYQQPYNSEYKGFNIISLWRNSLFGYIPYAYELEDNTRLYRRLLLMNVAWRVFFPSEVDVKEISKYLFNGGKNLISTGYLLADVLSKSAEENDFTIWKIKDKNIKRVIWAPHHSILEDDLLNYSTFLDIAEGMLELAAKYKHTLQFAFKPHPVLKRKLYKLADWGEERTEAYYAKWANGSNSVLVEGDYVSLFQTSHCLIHDCSTFSAEYLYTKKPVMFLQKTSKKDLFNEFGKKCIEQHYIGRSIDDVEFFIQNVVIKGNDDKQKDREVFYNNYLMPPNGLNAAHNIYREFVRALRP